MSSFSLSQILSFGGVVGIGIVGAYLYKEFQKPFLYVLTELEPPTEWVLMKDGEEIDARFQFGLLYWGTAVHWHNRSWSAIVTPGEAVQKSNIAIIRRYNPKKDMNTEDFTKAV